jgi:iron complex outermembrane receptor protein
MLKRTLFASASTAVMLTVAVQAHAEQTTQGAKQTADASRQASAGLQDIVITATRQTTYLQDTPIAITAVTAEALEQRGVTNIGDMTSLVPNSQFRRVQGAFGPGVSAFIRGIGSTDTGLGGESPVAFYIDDVYYPVLLGANFDLLDIDHIEVLRGPQGTLFGRNSLAGAINIVAKQPSTTETSAYVDATVGSFSRRDLRAGFNMPLTDNLALMVSGVSKYQQGYQKQLDFTCDMRRRGTPELAGTFPTTAPLEDTSTNYTVNDCTIGHFGGTDIRASRAVLLWEPTSSIKFTLTGDYSRDVSQNPADSIVDIDPTRANNNMKTQAAYFGLTIDSRFMPGSPYATYVTYSDRIPAGTLIPGNTYYNGTQTRGGYAIPPHNHIINWGVSGKLNWDLGHDIEMTAVLAHRTVDDYHTFDTDGMPLLVEHVSNAILDKYTDAEVRLAGKSDLIDWVGGLFYFDARGVQHANLQQGSFGGNRYLFTTYEPTSKAIFASATVRPFGEKLGIVLGARYADDKKVVNFSNVADFSATNPVTDIRFTVTPKQKKFSWKAGVNYQATDAMLFYASAATGYSLPGYNSRPLQKTQVGQFDGNNDIAYELGAKLDLLGRKLRLNAAAFYTDFNNRPSGVGGAEALLGPNDLPVPGNQVLIPLDGGPPGSTQCRATVQTPEEAAAGPGITCIGRFYYRNLPANIRGFELEYTIDPIENLTINGSVGWSRFMAPDIKSRTVNRRQSNPFWTANGGIQYRVELPMIGGSVIPRLDWTYESSQIVSGTSTKYNNLLPAKSLFNARLTYNNEDHDFTVALGVVNLFDKFYYVNVFDYQGLGYPQTDAQPAAPREWTLTVSKRF